ncbi:uncharacterized protein LOC124139841 [Haliotis rufescens]|uniref:uncharacterized protein LOC124139841 n=1 Tax=Haliotis rufescens TaxID=6454 RepID=UPI00201F2E55|nr:uncharacterized protein LOC124139841 [Haliotis rufescens]
MGLMRFIFKQIVFILLYGIFRQEVSSVITEEQTRSIEAFVSEYMACKGVSGLGIGIVKEDAVVARGFGVEDVDKQRNVTADGTLFAIGSTTKGFTAVVLAIAMEETQGRLTWDSKVADVLGEDFRFIDEERTKLTTIKDLLAHRTGLMGPGVALFYKYDSTYTRADLARDIRYLEEKVGFRDRWVYNNFIVTLAGHVAEVITEKTWEELLQLTIFDPLNMTSSGVLGTPILESPGRFTPGYYKKVGSVLQTPRHAYSIHPLEPAGGIVATVDDMVKWLQFLTADGRTEEGRQLLSAPMMKSMFDVHMFVPGDDNLVSMPTFPVAHLHRGYGLSWDIGNYRGFQFLWHAGLIGAHVSMVAVLPQFKLALFISSNTMTDLQPIVYYVVDLLSGLPQWLNSTSACSFPSPWKQDLHKSNESGSETDGHKKTGTPTDTEIRMESYIGSYGHRVFGELQVSLNRSIQKLYLCYGALQGPLVIEDTNKHVFQLNGVPNYVRFRTMVQGKFQNFVFLDESLFYTRGVRLSDPVSGSVRCSYHCLVLTVLAIYWMTGVHDKYVYWTQ